MAANKGLLPYIPMVKFLSEALGPQFEIVLHDLTDLDQSVVAIENNQISHRIVGSPATDLLLELVKTSQTLGNKDYITNYKGRARDGKTLKGSTFLIKDETQTPIGALCINMDISAFIQARDQLDTLIHRDEPKSVRKTEKVSEELEHSIEDLTANAVNNILSQTPIPPERMSPEEKLHIIDQLNKKGIFLLKGAVSEVAKQLKTSEPTIYRYLNKLK